MYKFKPEKLFLIDGLGAIVSAFLLGVILTKFESVFGMPRRVLYFLALIPCIFAVYDFGVIFRNPASWGPALKVIAIANLIYCGVSVGFVIHHYQKLTALGLIYFIVEVLIVIILSGIELKTAVNLRRKIN